MIVENCIIRTLGACRLVRFGNRSWIGLPFASLNDDYLSYQGGNADQEPITEIAFDFGDRLRVV